MLLRLINGIWRSVSRLCLLSIHVYSGYASDFSCVAVGAGANGQQLLMDAFYDITLALLYHVLCSRPYRSLLEGG